jgi:hypothetical protein
MLKRPEEDGGKSKVYAPLLTKNPARNLENANQKLQVTD